MKVQLIVLLFLLASFASLTSYVNPYGLEQPEPIEPYLNNKFPTISPAVGDWKAVNAFPSHTFVDPVAFQQVPNTNDFIVAEKPGRFISLIENNSGEFEKHIILDINEKVITSGDAGLINFILHPEFGQAGSLHENFIYAYYAFHPSVESGEIERINKFVRFEVIGENYTIDPASEFVLIQDYDPQGYHMGGGMCFDEEGFFYLSFGDGGSTNNAFGSVQQIQDRFWGGLIRIDLDNNESRSHSIRKNIIDYPGKPEYLPAAINQGYMVPNDNPFIDETGNTLEEFFGLGLRSPHRISYDEVENEIWIGDVGEAKFEEITILKKGGNGQWPFKEGRALGPKTKPNVIHGEENPPVFDYGREIGNSIIGGFVYRGEKWSQQLEGLYIYGDHGSRNVWSFNPQTSESVLLTNIPEFGEEGKSGIASFGTDEVGNIYVLKLFGTDKDGGVIYRLELETAPPEEIPTLLSETEAFLDLNTLLPNEGIIPYSVINPLWSDDAKKKRWIAIPNDGSFNSADELVEYFEEGEWKFPSGTVFIKHFDVPLDKTDPSLIAKIETRFFIIDDDGIGYGLTYRWFDDQSDAYLLESGETRLIDFINEEGNNEVLEWSFPSRVQCMTCHNANSNFVLGVNTYQLNGDLRYPSTDIVANQLKTWNHLGIFSNKMTDQEIDEQNKAVSLLDNEANLEDKVMSYLAANCSYCHRPNGVEGAFDARFETPLVFKNMIHASGKSHNNPIGGVIIKPKNHEESQLWIRDNSIDENKMPPIAKTQVDQTWIGVLTDWIGSLEENCSGIFLSDRDWQGLPINGYGPIGIDMSNGELGSSDGQDLEINGKKFEKGFGVHAYSEINFELNKEFAQFTSYIGVDSESCDQASIQFLVLVDNMVVFRSETMYLSDDARFVNIDLENASQLKLVVTSPNSNINCDHGDWADAKLYRTKDSDLDGVCDAMDLCEGVDDNIDEDQNGIPDGCERTNENSLEITIYPNPAKAYDNVFIQVPKPSDYVTKGSMTITDINGRIFYRENQFIFDSQYRIGKNLAAGNYFITVQAGKFLGTSKLIVFP